MKYIFYKLNNVKNPYNRFQISGSARGAALYDFKEKGKVVHPKNTCQMDR